MNQFPDERGQTKKDIPRSPQRSGSLRQTRQSRYYYPKKHLLTKSLTSFSQIIQRASNTAPRRLNLRSYAKFKETMDLAQKSFLSAPHSKGEAAKRTESRPGRLLPHHSDLGSPSISELPAYTPLLLAVERLRQCRPLLPCSGSFHPQHDLNIPNWNSL